MGAAVSNWRLANAVAREGQMGVVSGTALDVVLARRLQDGDEGGHMRRALSHFPAPEVAQRILARYFLPGGRSAGQPYRTVPKFTVPTPMPLQELVVAANFVEVFLAREGHDGPVGINYLEKIQMPNLPSAFGAMLAGVDYVLMGAGIPREMPGVLDGLAAHRPVSVPLHIEGAREGESFRIDFDPAAIVPELKAPLRRPRFLAIVASTSLALTLARKASGKVDGLIIEMPTAGGHNAPPRGAMQVDEAGEPVYGPRDEVDLAKVAELGLPFWLAGQYGRPGRLAEARARGAAGIQVGTAFAMCRESGLDPEIRHRVLKEVAAGTLRVFTDPVASPTGFPFKVVRLEGTMSEATDYAERRRICDLGYLRTPWRRDDGTVGYRCSSEPVEKYVAKGGDIADTVNRKCLCNGLMANVGMAQLRPWGDVELPLMTAGNAATEVTGFIPAGSEDYSAADVIRRLLGEGGDRCPRVDSSPVPAAQVFDTRALV